MALLKNFPSSDMISVVTYHRAISMASDNVEFHYDLPEFVLVSTTSTEPINGFIHWIPKKKSLKVTCEILDE